MWIKRCLCAAFKCCDSLTHLCFNAMTRTQIIWSLCQRMTIHRLVLVTKPGQTSSVLRNWHRNQVQTHHLLPRKAKLLLPASKNVWISQSFGAITKKTKIAQWSRTSTTTERGNRTLCCELRRLRPEPRERFYFCTLQTHERRLKNTHKLRQNKKTGCYSDGGVGTEM